MLVFIICFITLTCVSSTYPNSRATCVSPIYFRSNFSSNALPDFILSAQTQNIFLTSVCIRGVTSVILNCLIRPDFIDLFTSSHILSDTNPSGIFSVTSIKGLKLFPLIALSIYHKDPPICSHWTICVILLYIVLSQYLPALIIHLAR